MNSTCDDAGGYYHYEDINHAVVRILREAKVPSLNSPTVLDVGCGRGRLGLEVEHLGYRVAGLDNSPVALATARERISEVIEVDITDYDRVAQSLEGRRFDWLLTADSLEHCADPWGVLAFYRRFLKPDGRLLLSLPNVAVWDNRLRILFGRFDYTDSGVMDRTHLRFFTFRSAKKLVGKCGYTLESCTREPGIVRAFLPVIKRFVRSDGQSPGAILESRYYRLYERRLMPIENAIAGIAPGLFAIRVVITARTTNS